MRVLLVSQEFPPETRWGGIGTYAGILAPALARAGTDVHVLSVVRGQARSNAIVDGVHVHRRPLVAPPGIGRVSGSPETSQRVVLGMAVARAFDALTRDVGGFDVVECPDWNAEGWMLTRRTGLPVVVRLHSMAAQLFPYLGPVGRDQAWAIRVEDAAIRRATLVSGTGAQITAVADRLHLPAAQLRALTLPVAPAPDADVAFARAEPGRIVFAGRFEQRKAPEVLVRALPAVRAELPHARLVMIGRDCARPEHPSAVAWLREMAATLGVGDAVEIIDQWGDADTVRDHMLRASVCATPSRWESFGYVAAEAAALGRPVVATAIPGFADVVADGVSGRLAAAGDGDAWAGALFDVLRDNDRAIAMGRAGLTRMRTECDPDLVAAQTLSVYADAAALPAGEVAA